MPSATSFQVVRRSSSSRGKVIVSTSSASAAIAFSKSPTAASRRVRGPDHERGLPANLGEVGRQVAEPPLAGVAGAAGRIKRAQRLETRLGLLQHRLVGEARRARVSVDRVFQLVQPGLDLAGTVAAL
ncbi:MAG: hypothetical protein QF893_11700 [Alphaproteobacteria bacterium]|jgi:hypothetical protein|nr:hypothetical protein [Alphaproteobacteria bacterium]